MANKTESPMSPEVTAEFDKAPPEVDWVLPPVPCGPLLLEVELPLELGARVGRALMLLQAALALVLVALPPSLELPGE